MGKIEQIEHHVMRMCIANNIKSSLFQIENANEYFKAMEDGYRSAKKFLDERLMAKLTTIKFNSIHGMNEHILKMNHSKFKTLEVNVDESLFIQFILNFLPPQV